MAYEKKIEPLSKYEVIMCGFTLVLWILFLHVTQWSTGVEGCIKITMETDIKSIDDLTDFHDCIKKYSGGFLAGATFLLLGYPIIIAHVYYIHRVFETILSFLNFGFIEYMYIGSWIIIATIYCCIIPSLTIFCTYYEWEFNDEYKYSGYSMQFQFFHFLLILWDVVILPMGISASIPWFFIICCLFGLFKSSHYELSNENMILLAGNFINCPKCGKIFISIICLSMILMDIFGSFADVFDYSKDGFFSYDGDSQWLFTILYLSWIITAILSIHFGSKLEKHTSFLNENVKSLDHQSAS